MSQSKLLETLARHLETAGIPFMVAGSHGSSYHGQPRATNDLDIVIDPAPEQLERFLHLVRERYYVSPEAARDALARRSMFNIIDFNDGSKADLIIRKERPFSIEEFRRKQPGTLLGTTVPVASAEDIILTKLEWDKITPSERQIQDAMNVALVQWPKLDLAYLRKWAPSLGVVDKLEELLRQAEELQRPQP